MDFSKLLHGFVEIDTCIFLRETKKSCADQEKEMDGNPKFERFVLVFQHNILFPVTVTKLLIDDRYFIMLHIINEITNASIQH